MNTKKSHGEKTLQIQEVGPRDGFQIIEQFIPTEIKLETIDLLIKSGIKKIQVTSFVNPKAVPQMSDASEIASICVQKYPDASIFALVPNLRGADNAVNAGLNEIAVVLSLSESHNKANVGKTVAESIDELKRIKDVHSSIKIDVDISTAFSCPFEGEMEISKLVELVGNLYEIGIRDMTLCDTIGSAYPSQIVTAFDTVLSEYADVVFNVHIHDTRNMGMLNTYLAILHGAVGVQSSLGGLGGCPFAPGASGNTATEDLVYMLGAEGFDTGVDFGLLLDAARFLKEHVDGNYSGHHITIKS